MFISHLYQKLQHFSYKICAKKGHFAHILVSWVAKYGLYRSDLGNFFPDYYFRRLYKEFKTYLVSICWLVWWEQLIEWNPRTKSSRKFHQKFKSKNQTSGNPITMKLSGSYFFAKRWNSWEFYVNRKRFTDSSHTKIAFLADFLMKMGIFAWEVPLFMPQPPWKIQKFHFLVIKWYSESFIMIAHVQVDFLTLWFSGVSLGSRFKLRAIWGTIKYYPIDFKFCRRCFWVKRKLFSPGERWFNRNEKSSSKPRPG